MAEYRLAIGTRDPYSLDAATDGEAIRLGVGYLVGGLADVLQSHSQEVVTLLGPAGLVTRPGERVDEFARRVSGRPDVSETFQPGDANTPDCNGD